MTSASCVSVTTSPISSLKYGKCQLPTPGSTTPSSAVNRLAVIVAIGFSSHLCRDVRSLRNDDTRPANSSSHQDGAAGSCNLPGGRDLDASGSCSAQQHADEPAATLPSSATTAQHRAP